MKDYYTTIKQICIAIILICVGALIGINLPDNKTNKKNYPIEVQTHWQTNQVSSYPTIEADSVKGDTIWKDGNKIVNKNIINVAFK